MKRFFLFLNILLLVCVTTPFTCNAMIEKQKQEGVDYEKLKRLSEELHSGLKLIEASMNKAVKDVFGEETPEEANCFRAAHNNNVDFFIELKKMYDGVDEITVGMRSLSTEPEKKFYENEETEHGFSRIFLYRTKTKENTVLHIAAEYACVELIAYFISLIEDGIEIDVNAKNKFKETPLRVAQLNKERVRSSSRHLANKYDVIIELLKPLTEGGEIETSRSEGDLLDTRKRGRSFRDRYQNFLKKRVELRIEEKEKKKSLKKRLNLRINTPLRNRRNHNHERKRRNSGYAKNGFEKLKEYQDFSIFRDSKAFEAAKAKYKQALLAEKEEEKNQKRRKKKRRKKKKKSGEQTDLNKYFNERRRRKEKVKKFRNSLAFRRMVYNNKKKKNPLDTGSKSI